MYFFIVGEQFPGIVLGHEIAATIEDLGADTKPSDYQLKIGDSVIVYPWVGCGKCDACQIGYTNECKDNPGLRFNYGFGHKNPGGYATHVIIHDLQFLIKIPENIPKHIASMLPCSGLTAFTALKKTRHFIEEGFSRHKVSKLLIFGAGGLGLWAIKLAKCMFAHKNIEITVVGVNADKNEFAKANGADFVVLCKREIDNREKFAAEVGKITSNRKFQFDAAIDFVGSSTTFRLAYGSIRSSGTLVSVGTYGGNFDLPITEFTIMQYNIQGNCVGTISDLRELIEFVQKHQIEYSAIGYTSLEEINTVFEKFKNRKIKGRVLIKF